MLNIALFGFVLLFFFSFYADGQSVSRRRQLMIIFYFIIVYCIGLRAMDGWIDTAAYCLSFTDTTKTLSTFSFSDTPYAYSEKGYYFLCVIAKTISADPQFYLYFIGALSMLFLFPALIRYSPLPFLGVFIYIARFMLSRDMNQMRAGLALTILFWGIVFLSKQKRWLYLALVLFAYTIHRSVLVVIPFIFINSKRISKTLIVYGVIGAYLTAAFFGGPVSSFVGGWDFAQDMAGQYLDSESEKGFSNDLTNPMIHFQTIILLVYTFMENKLAKRSVHYYTIRNAYFYSTLILTILCQYAVVAARLSTIYATYEVVIIPSILLALPKGQKPLGYFALFVTMVFFFIKNWPGTNYGI